MVPWYGFEYIWNKTKEHKAIKDKISNPMAFSLRGTADEEPLKFYLEVVADAAFNNVYFQNYKSAYDSGELTPMPQKRSSMAIHLNRTGSNIAEYLQSIRDQDLEAFNGIIETLREVLPFAEDLQPRITSELDRKVYLSLAEKNIADKLPRWLLSTGTLRILALLAALHHPNPKPVMIIEEIENGLDPRTVHMLVEEIRYFVESGRGQVIITTHSPYLLDLLKLSQIVVVERDASSAPLFSRPATQKSLEEWALKFSPGKLYTMGRLKRS